MRWRVLLILGAFLVALGFVVFPRPRRPRVDPRRELPVPERTVGSPVRPPPELTEEEFDEGPVARRTVTVRVLSGSDTKPIAGATVRVTNDELGELATTDSEGVARLPTDEPDVVWVRVEKEGYLLREDDLAAGEKEIDVYLLAGVPLRGRVVRVEDRSPVPDALVWAKNRATDEELLWEAQVDAEGRFVVPGAPKGARYVVGAAAPGYGPASVRGCVGEEEVTIVLGRGASLHGTIHTPEGEPAAGARVFVSSVKSRFLRRSSGAISLRPSRLVRSAQAVTDDSGRYEVRGLPAPAQYLFRAESRDHAAASLEPIVVSKSTDRFEVDLRLTPPTGIRLTVLDPEGRPVPRPVAWVRDGHGRYVRSVRRLWPRVGESILLLEKPGDYVLEVRTSRWRPSTVRVQVQQERLTSAEVQLDPGLPLEGVVLDEEGRPVPGAEVTVGGERRTLTAEDGSFRINGLGFRHGHLEVNDWRHRFLAWSSSEYVSGRPPITIVLKRGAGITGRFAPVPPLRRMLLSINAGNAAWSYEARLERDGSFAVTGIPAGERVAVVFQPRSACPLKHELEPLAQGERRDLGTLSFLPGRTLTGRVIDQEGQPVAGARTAVNGGGLLMEQSTITDSEGRFRIEHLPEAPLSLVVWYEEDSGHGFELEAWWTKPPLELKIVRY